MVALCGFGRGFKVQTAEVNTGVWVGGGVGDCGWVVGAMEEPLSLRVRAGRMSSLISGPPVSALMHLAISMFLLVATGSAAPPPRLTCQNAYQSQRAVARGLHITKREREGEMVWVRVVSASVSVFLSLVEFYLFGMRMFLRGEVVPAGCHFFQGKFRVRAWVRGE